MTPLPDGRGAGGEGPPLPREPRRFARTLRHFATGAEDKLWQALRGRKLAGLKFRRQVPLSSHTVDFPCIDRRLIVELDGRQHAWFAEYDARRTEEIESQGFTVLRFTNEAVLGELDVVLARITSAAALDAAAAIPHSRPLSHPGEGRRAP